MGISLGAIGTIGGGIVGGIFGGPGGAAMGASAGGALGSSLDAQDQFDKTMSFQKHMSNTAYQRAMADMRAAGLNPMLAYMHGGASTPSGSAPNIVNPAPSIAAGISSAVQYEKMGSEIAQTQAQTELTQEQAQTQQTQRDALVAEQVRNKAQAAQAASAADLNRVESELKKHDLPEAKNRSDIAKTPQGSGMTYLDRIIKMLSPIKPK